ncbi:MAG: helix-turn-helix domain-containing protein [Christensenellaceae bacterium]|jgi:transcriptional regulator with XRE-family HTH domain|nr:helix-turn-helix domain-containing protein [Christensenellaceae bacterium]
MLKDQIKELRIIRGLSQTQMATLLNMSRTGYASWEQGLSEPNSSDLRKLCVIFDVTADELLEIETPEERRRVIINYMMNIKDNKKE